MKTWGDFGIEVPSKGGSERYTLCPQCSADRKRGSNRKKCLSVNVDKEVWNCHHCGWAGTLKGGARKAKELHWQAPEYILPSYDAYKKLDDRAIKWFAERGIPADILTRNRITSGPIYMPQLEAEANAIQFPFYRGGICVNVKYRDGVKNFRMEAAAERIFFGLDDVDKDFTVIVEGEMDKLAIEAAGIKACISVPDGAPDPESREYSNKFIFLENSKAQLEPIKCFAIAVDNDAAGKRLESELLHRLGKDRCTLVQWPDGCKDANDVLIKHGPDILAQCIYEAEPPPIYGVVRVRNITERLEKFYDEEMRPGVNVGWENIAEFYRVSTGEWTLVTGIPGHGKSEFLDAMLINLAGQYDWRFAIYSPENHPLEQHVAKILEKRISKPFRGAEWIKMSREELHETALWADRHFQFMHPDEDNLSLASVLELTKSVIYRDGIKGLVIDPWNELEHHRPQHQTETEYISECLTQIRRFARSNNIHIWVVAHPTKLFKDKNGIYPIPTAYDVSGSAHWHNKADNCLAVWRNKADDTQPVQIHVQKIRFKKNGHLGRADLLYDSVTGRYSDAPVMPSPAHSWSQ